MGGHQKEHGLVLYPHFQELIRCFSDSYADALMVAVLYREKYKTDCFISWSIPVVNDSTLRKAIAFAAANNDLPLLETLIREIQNLSKTIKDLFSTKQKKNEENALWLALHYEHDEIINYLLKEGLDPNGLEDDVELTSYLHKAVMQDKFVLVNEFLKAGAKVNHQDWEGCTPLHLACLYGKDQDIAKLLVTYGADINIVYEKEYMKGSLPPIYYVQDNIFKKQLMSLAEKNKPADFKQQQTILVVGLFSKKANESSLTTLSRDYLFDRNIVNIVSNFLRPK
ncbi:MAG: ankyrin repeat domain-containing protein [Gammaproteobacteria bacterium]|nr:ankyrin repeat domain-containing protein [Gammaproteobacteria bacterium]